MMTVRYPNGHCVQYNTANYVVWGTNVMSLYTEKDGRAVAFIPYESGAILEFTKPCRVYNTKHEPDEALDALLEDIRTQRQNLEVYKLAELKRALEAFDARRRTWK